MTTAIQQAWDDAVQAAADRLQHLLEKPKPEETDQ